MFNQVYIFIKANDIWLKLEELHDGSSNVGQQKYCLVKSFSMLLNELVKDMYSCLNLIINKLNAIGLTKVSNANMMRASIVTILRNIKYLSSIILSFAM